MTIHQRRTHPSYVEECYACKLSTIAFGTVPGGSKDSKVHVSKFKEKEKALHAYRERRRAGEQPDSISMKGIRDVEKRAERWDKTESRIADYTPPAKVKQFKKSYLNTE